MKYSHNNHEKRLHNSGKVLVKKLSYFIELHVMKILFLKMRSFDDFIAHIPIQCDEEKTQSF